MKIPVLPGFDPEAFAKYVKNAGWLMIGKVGTLLIKMLVGIAIANYLGADGNGVLAYPMALITFFIAASGLGLDAYLTRELIEKKALCDYLLGTAFRIRLFAGILVLPLIYAVYAWIALSASPPVPFSYIVIVSFVCLFQAMNVLDCYFQSLAQGKRIMIVHMCANLLSAILKLLLIYFKASISWFIWMLLFDAIFIALGFIAIYLQSGRSIAAWKFDRKIARILIQNAWPLMFTAILISLYMKIDQVMIGVMLPESELGIYSTVVSLSESWYFIPVAIVAAVFPAIMHARRTDKQRYKKRLQNLYDVLSLLSISIALIMTFASPYLYKLLYTTAYQSGAKVLSIHIWAGVFVFLGTASGQYLIAERYLKLSMLRTAAGAIVNIGLNFWWIPLFGINGAAMATLVAYAVSTFLVLCIPKTYAQGVMMLKSIFLMHLVKRIFNR